jgi:hypothetical protein
MMARDPDPRNSRFSLTSIQLISLALNVKIARRARIRLEMTD